MHQQRQNIIHNNNNNNNNSNSIAVAAAGASAPSGSQYRPCYQTITTTYESPLPNGTVREISVTECQYVVARAPPPSSQTAVLLPHAQSSTPIAPVVGSAAPYVPHLQPQQVMVPPRPQQKNNSASAPSASTAPASAVYHNQYPPPAPPPMQSHPPQPQPHPHSGSGGPQQQQQRRGPGIYTFA
eukprot:PhM_4_TR2114/c2_g4_i1/m.57596